MRIMKGLFALAIMLMVILLGCSNSTESKKFDETDVVQAIQEMDMLMGSVVTSNGYSSITQMPEMDQDNPQGTAKMRMPELRFMDGDSTDDVDALLFLLYAIFVSKGTYTCDGVNWTYSEIPNDETIFIFPYADITTGLTHTAMWRYYDMVETDTLFQISFDVTVDDVQFVGITLEITGEVTVENQQLQPVIHSVVITGFVKDNKGVQYNLALTLDETEMTLSLSQANKPPLIIDLSGDLGLSLSKKSQPLTCKDWITDATIYNYGQLEISQQDLMNLIFNDLDGTYGYILWDGEKVADLVVKSKIMYVQWKDGRLVLAQEYANFSLSGGGAII